MQIASKKIFFLTWKFEFHNIFIFYCDIDNFKIEWNMTYVVEIFYVMWYGMQMMKMYGNTHEIRFFFFFNFHDTQ